MTKRLDAKIAIITGAASGLGRACAERFALEGATVVIADVNEKEGEAAVASLSSGCFMRVDVTDPASVEALVATTVERYGRLDILVNNAGIDGDQAPTTECTLENWRRVIAVNLDGVFYGMKYGIAAMVRDGRGGSVLNMASVAGLVGLSGVPSYSAAKGGVIQLTKAAAIEYADRRVRVNALCPTGVITPLVEHFIQSDPDPVARRAVFQTMNPIPGSPSPADIACAALLLVSDEATFITGVALPVDGGYTAR